MRHPVELGPRTFPSKIVARDYVSTEILHGYAIGVPITDPEHVGVLEAVVHRKLNAAEKIGGGIDYFYVAETRSFRPEAKAEDRCIAIHHLDATEPDVDCSYVKAIAGDEQVQFVTDALREGARPLRDAFRASAFSSTPTFDFYGTPLTTLHEAEVRYLSPSWGQLVLDFVQSEGGWSAVETTSGAGAPLIGRRLVDPDVLDRWHAFWRAHADPILVKKR